MTSSVDHVALRAAREAAGLTQHKLAWAVGVVGGEVVARWERGASEPKPETLVRAAKLLGVAPAELIRSDGGERDLRFLRLCAGLTSAEVAARLGVSVATYLRWERGSLTKMVPAPMLQALARILVTEPAAVEDALKHARRLAEGAAP